MHLSRSLLQPAPRRENPWQPPAGLRVGAGAGSGFAQPVLTPAPALLFAVPASLFPGVMIPLQPNFPAPLIPHSLCSLHGLFLIFLLISRFLPQNPLFLIRCNPAAIQ